MCSWDSSLIKNHLFQSYSLEAAAVNEGMTFDTIRDDIEVARQLLRKTQEQFDKLEFTVSRIKYPPWLMVVRCKSSNLVTWKFHVIILILQLCYLTACKWSDLSEPPVSTANGFLVLVTLGCNSGVTCRASFMLKIFSVWLGSHKILYRASYHYKNGVLP